ncbi:DUF3742 family protein [Komagataeibacter nataicola]|uniref:DUF3742 family protein n=1 Tax=Komagataeibacter rhaeticus TaxID=215221 RepID=A0A858JC95_9PROT|nr:MULTISPECIES: DUF3742 family protein [Komagataeibacter]QIP34455.1 DUF3742 family protein [Komagataeibacter rhaeticus]QOC46972.1 DUF3742 family protein [Komagataeibacter rhaeticus]WEQ55748.1 DUF3742 family protein [Komagataeibacter nataicola]
MTPKTQSNNAERMGRWLGKVWRAYARRERQTMAWLKAHGLPSGVVIASSWIVRLGVLAMLCHVAFWLTLLLVFGLVAAGMISTSDTCQDEPTGTEWRYGPLGHGLYTYDGYRVDPHDPDEEQD